MRCKKQHVFISLIEIKYFYCFITDTHLVRKAPPAYSDGVYALAGANRPSPRRLSRLFMRGEDGLASKNNRTALLAFFGKKFNNTIVCFIL